MTRKCRDVGGKGFDRVRSRLVALTVSGQVHADDPMRSGEMIELRGKKAAIAAPAMQEEHVRIALSRGVERKPARVRLSVGPSALLFDRGHRVLLGFG